MLKSASRLLTAATLSSALLLGGLALAPAANAATKVGAPGGSATLLIAKGDKVIASDKLTIRHEGTASARFDGLTVYRYYTLTIKHGKTLLFERKHLSYAKSSFIAGNVFLREFYPSQAAALKVATAAAKVSENKATALQLKAEVNLREAVLRSDVQQTELNVATWLTAGNGGTYKVVNSHVRGLETVKVTLGVDGNFKVVGVDGYDHFTFTYDSSKG